MIVHSNRTRTMATTATDTSSSAKGYAHPEALVSTSWLAEHLSDDDIRIIESDEDVLLFDSGHIPNAQKVDWHEDLNHAVTRDYVDREAFQLLLRRLGIDESKTVVFYGDKSNWWATYAFWVFQLFGFENAKILDGGRLKWEQEGRALVRGGPTFSATKYVAPARSDSRIRAFRDEVLAHSSAKRPLIDVRSPDEYSGKKTHIP